MLDFKTEGSCRRWRERWPSKIDSNWGKHCCCCWFGQEWPSNRIKNDNRIFEQPEDCSFSDSEMGFGKEKVVYTFCSTLLDAWAKGRSRHILPRHYRDGWCRKKIFEQNYYGRWDLVFCLWPRNKATEFWMGWWDIPSAEETLIPKVPYQEHVDNFFFGSKVVVHKEFVPEGKTVNAEFYKGVMDRLLKRIQRVRPAAFCSRDFFLLHDNAPTHKAASVCQFLTPKNVTTRTLKIYLR